MDALLPQELQAAGYEYYEHKMILVTRKLACSLAIMLSAAILLQILR